MAWIYHRRGGYTRRARSQPPAGIVPCQRADIIRPYKLAFTKLFTSFVEGLDAAREIDYVNLWRWCSLKQKLWAAAAALLGLLAVNLHIRCAVGFEGEGPQGSYSPAALRQGLAAAEAAAEEILPGMAEEPSPRLWFTLSLSPPKGESRTVADAALRATPGVSVLDGVYLGGRQLGTVQNGSRFAGRVQAWLYDGMPRTARHAGLLEALETRPVYAREGSAQDPDELFRAVTAAAQTWYTDADGHVISG